MLLKSSFFANLISGIGSTYSVFDKIIGIIGIVFTVLLAYRAVWAVLGFFVTRKFPLAENKHKYGIVIAARNESAVIGNLLDSIAKQDYPKELLTVFVVADNCTDNTAEIARSKGAICYERFDGKHKTKGFALQFLFDRIGEDYGRDSFEGYFVFDADNLLKEDYISRMNDSFDSGSKIITSYRNTKNLGESWIASTYALHWIRSIRFNHRARSFLRLATNIQGTGFLFSNEIVRDGWKYTSLTEDRALTADCVAQGYQITYNDAAEFFDEQPNSLKIAFRQRLRWSKGHLMAFAETGPMLLVNVIFGKRFLKNPWNKPKKTQGKRTSEEKKKAFIESIRHRAASYDTLLHLTPVSLLYTFNWLLCSVIIFGCYSFTNGISPSYLFDGSGIVAVVLRLLFPVKIAVDSGIKAFFVSMLLAVWWRLLWRAGSYFGNTWCAIYLFIVERKRIVKIPFWKKVLFVFTWPVFDIIGRYTQYLAVFVKVTWKPIPHDSKITIDDINKSK